MGALDHLRRRREDIIEAWEANLRKLPAFAASPSSQSKEALRDHLPDLLDQLADWLERSPSSDEGTGVKSVPAASAHALERLELGLDIGSMVHEYRLLRRAIFDAMDDSPTIDRREAIALDDAIDQAIADGVACYCEERRRRSDEARDRFIAILGHDLRNPLTAISTAAASMLRFNNAPERQAHLAERIVRIAARMSRMIGDILDSTRAKRGQPLPVTRRPTDMATLCERAIEELELSQPERRVTFEPSGDLGGEWDAERVEQVIQNLLSNAVKHGVGPVRTVARADGDHVVLEVHNGGPPISEADLAHLFEPFHATSAGGLGLGLFIVREIVRSHGGSVDVRSTAEQGTTIAVRLPRQPPAGQSARAAGESAARDAGTADVHP